MVMIVHKNSRRINTINININNNIASFGSAILYSVCVCVYMQLLTSCVIIGSSYTGASSRISNINNNIKCTREYYYYPLSFNQIVSNFLIYFANVQLILSQNNVYL